MAWALTKTHGAGIIHRDLKPENLFLTERDDGSPCVKILDFGIAKIVAGSSGAKTTRNMGTPYYMSPEQLFGEGNIDQRADIYALGHVAFTLLVGKAFRECGAESPQGAEKGASECATARAARLEITLPARFDAWFQQATANEPSQRHSSATQLVQELSVALGVPLPRTSAPPREGSDSLPLIRSKSGLAKPITLSIVGVILLLTIAAAVNHSLRVSPPAASVPSMPAATVSAAPATPVLSVQSAVPLPSAPITQSPSALPPLPGAREHGNRKTAPTTGSRTGAGQSPPASSPQRDPTDER